MELFYKTNPVSSLSKEELYNMFKVSMTPEDILQDCFKLALT